MQDRRLLCFILALVGGVFALAAAAMMLFVCLVMFGAMPGASTPGFVVGLFGWFAFANALGGVLLLVAAPRLRRGSGQAHRRAAKVAIAGGAATLLGGNLMAAALGIVAGAILLTEPASAPAAPPS